MLPDSNFGKSQLDSVIMLLKVARNHCISIFLFYHCSSGGDAEDRERERGGGVEGL